MTSSLTKTALARQISHALLRPAARLAGVRGTSLRACGNAMQLAYFHELMERGLKMREIAEHMNISMRKAALLSSDLKQMFFSMYRETELPRRIEFLLWAKPMSRARIVQTLPGVKKKEVDAALDTLLRTGRIQEQKRINSVVYARTERDVRLVSDEMFARLDGLNHLLQSLYHAVFGHFFENDPDVMVRTMSVQLTNADLKELRRFYEKTVRKKLLELEKKNHNKRNTKAVNFSVLFAPTPEDET